MKTCPNCSEILEGKSQKKYCSQQCQASYKKKQVIKDWLSEKIVGHKGKIMNIKQAIREYVFEKYKSKCCKCGWDIPHPLTGKPPLEVNHIDGDASNSIESNLNLLCPNCHSLTPNFKNRNKGNGKRVR